MKNIKFYILAILGCALLVCCGDDEPVGKHYEYTFNAPAEGCYDSLYVLSDLHNQGFGQSNDCPSWMFINWVYTRLEITVNPNDSGVERRTDVSFYDDTNTVTLHIVQPPLSSDSDDPDDLDYFDHSSGNPAYGKKRI